MSCCLQRANGVPPGSGGGSTPVAANTWTERFLGDLSAAPVVDLSAGVNPPVVVSNGTATAGQVANATLTSNAGDATPAVTQGPVTTFDTDGATGLRMVGAAASTLMTETSQVAPHVFWNWSDVLGEDPQGGVDYCFMVRVASETLTAAGVAGQAFGTVLYAPNDGATEPNIVSFPAQDDERAMRSWYENLSGTVSIIGREESTPFMGIQGPLIPAGWDTVGLVVHASGTIETIVGLSAGGVLPDPDDCDKVPGAYMGGSVTFTQRPYLTAETRLAIAFQQQLGGTYNATIDTMRVLSRLGRSSP